MQEVCAHLLPNGRLAGSNWKVGSIAGESGDSLAIQVTGPRAGIWSDFAGGQKGDVLDLWQQVRGCDFITAKQEAEQFLGGAPVPINSIPKSYTAPGKLENSTTLDSCKEAEAYIKGTRLITEETIARFRVRFLPETRDFVFPYVDRKGEVKNRKYIGLDRPNGKKRCRIEKNGYPILFGWHGIRLERNLIICEGEIDALTWNQIGFPCLSVPSGVENMDWITLEWENLECFEVIMLSFDMDDAGQKNISEVARRLGIGKCRIVKLGYKDANECLQKGWTKNNFIEAIEQAKPITLNKIIDIEEAGRISDAAEANPPTFFYFRLIGNAVAFGKSELNIWAGYTSHGKTTVLNNLVVEAAMHGNPVLIASLEQDPDENLRCMERILTVSGNPTKEEKLKARKKLAGKIFFLNEVGRVSTKDVLFYVEYACSRFGVKHVIIDSLMMMDLPADDFNGQKKFGEDLRNFARRFKCDIHLVIHTVKDFSEHDMKITPSLASLRGSSDLGNATDNAFFVRRNPKKFDEEKEHNPDEPDTLIVCMKNRRGGYRGTIPLSFHRPSGQFSRGTPFKPAPYANWVSLSEINEKENQNE